MSDFHKISVPNDYHELLIVPRESNYILCTFVTHPGNKFFVYEYKNNKLWGNFIMSSEDYGDNCNKEFTRIGRVGDRVCYASKEIIGDMIETSYTASTLGIEEISNTAEGLISREIIVSLLEDYLVDSLLSN